MWDRDKPRTFEMFNEGYRKIMYGEPPLEWDDMADLAKEMFRDQARFIDKFLTETA